jgi:membrane protease YdiL (CAAX protease family)
MEQLDNGAAPESASSQRFRLEVGPIATALLLGIAILLLSALSVDVVEHFTRLPERPQMPWIREFYEHVAQLAYALAAIAIIGKYRPADHGLHRPQGNSYVGAAIGWGLLFGVLMTFVDYWPQILAHKPPADKPYPLTVLNIAGWFSFEGVFAGPSEEVLFRGLLVTYLTQAMPGRVSFRGYAMNGAGIVVAVLFALAHFGNFFTEPFLSALGQQFYAVALGVLYAYWFEKSRSLLAPIVGHNVSNVTEYVFIFAMVALWG